MRGCRLSCSDKWSGPCVWPSWRRSAAEGTAVKETLLDEYNAYTCQVAEVYCGRCELFLGHKFEDGRVKGDDGPQATGWRH